MTHVGDLRRSRVSDHHCLRMIRSTVVVHDPLLVSWRVKASWVYCFVSTMEKMSLKFDGTCVSIQACQDNCRWLGELRDAVPSSLVVGR